MKVLKDKEQQQFCNQNYTIERLYIIPLTEYIFQYFEEISYSYHEVHLKGYSDLLLINLTKDIYFCSYVKNKYLMDLNIGDIIQCRNYKINNPYWVTLYKKYKDDLYIEAPKLGDSIIELSAIELTTLLLEGI